MLNNGNGRGILNQLIKYLNTIKFTYINIILYRNFKIFSNVVPFIHNKIVSIVIFCKQVNYYLY